MPTLSKILLFCIKIEGADSTLSSLALELQRVFFVRRGRYRFHHAVADAECLLEPYKVWRLGADRVGRLPAWQRDLPREVDYAKLRTSRTSSTYTPRKSVWFILHAVSIVVVVAEFGPL